MIFLDIANTFASVPHELLWTTFEQKVFQAEENISWARMKIKPG